MSRLDPFVPLALCALAACAVNPATGRRELSLIGESQEVQIGREADQEIQASMGRYEDTALEAYVQQVGARLAAVSERPGLAWQFKVLDDPAVNAFALPGGYVYVTRGLLAHLDSEAELAGVIGHEIGHVTARHAVSQMSKAQLATLGLGIGAMLSPEFAELGQLAETGVGLLFLKFGRDDESQADHLGLRYMSAAGYDPAPMTEVFDVLRRVGESEGGGRVPGWLSTHPAPEKREAETSETIARRYTGSVGAGRVDREPYLSRIDGMVFGDDPRQGYFEKNRFLHPGMKFRLDFPPDWKTSNQKTAVAAASPGKDAVIRVTLSAEPSPDAAARTFFQKQGVTPGNPWRDSFHGLPAVSRGFEATTSSGTLRGAAAFIAHGGRVFQLVALTPQDRWGTYREAILASLATFQTLTDPAALGVQPDRVDIVTLSEALSVRQVAERYRSAAPAEKLALINHAEVEDRLEAGRKVKVVVGRAPAP